MLEQFFNDPEARRRLMDGPQGPHHDSFAASLVELGYANSTARAKLQLLAEFGVWLQRNNLAFDELDERIVTAFVDDRRSAGRLRRGDAFTVHRFVAHLRKKGALALHEPEEESSPLSRIESEYRDYLKQERGLSPVTGDGYWHLICRFLVERFENGPLDLHELSPSDISSFVVRQAPTMSPGRAKLMLTAFRSFFRFLFQNGRIEVELAAAVPLVATWRLSTIPKYLTTDQCVLLLDACDRSTATGRRDYAILLLALRLGFRAGEVVALELDDLDWRAGEVLVRGKGLRHDRLPLPTDVGEALAVYLRRDRPECSTRRVFVRMKAPRRGFAGSSTVSTVVRRALERAGLQPPTMGAHLLRHTLATGMLRQGASMAEIGELLRHRSPGTTEIYAKVDIDGLRSLAQPWQWKGGGR